VEPLKRFTWVLLYALALEVAESEIELGIGIRLLRRLAELIDRLWLVFVKTLLMTTLGDVLGLQVTRVQFTPDLMPADIIGTRILQQDEKNAMRFDFERGPVFTQILLADEVRRSRRHPQPLSECRRQETGSPLSSGARK
jgi:hypothetical protein